MEMPDNNAVFTDAMESHASPFIRQTMLRKHITGLSIALVDDREVLFAKGYGLADKRENRPATPRTLYKIGSITKVFTGTAVMQLAEKGLLDIDRPISEYIPEFSIRSRLEDISQITPRTLMTHHSGIPSDWYFEYTSDDPHAFRNVLAYLRGAYLAFPPNTVFSYSNLATSLMGIIIERVSGLPYQQYIEKNILTPLGMRDSAADPKNVSLALLSKAYSQDKEAKDPMMRDAPAGAIFSNAEDMARFTSTLLAGGSYRGATMLSSYILAEMLRPQNEAVKLDLGFRIGLNWMLSRPSLSFAGRVCWHDGGTPHFYSILIALPDIKLGAVVLSNSDGGMINVGIIAEEILKQATSVKSGRNAAALEKRDTPVPIKTNPPEDVVTGQFASANGMVRIVRHKKTLRAIMQGQQFSLNACGDEWYSLRLLLFGFLPIHLAPVASLRLTVRTIDGRRILGFEQYGLQMPLGVEYAPVPIPKEWITSLGEYRLIGGDEMTPFALLRLTMEEGILTLQAKARKVGKMSLILQPLSGTEAGILGFGRTGGVAVELLDDSGSKSLRMLGMEFRKS